MKHSPMKNYLRIFRNWFNQFPAILELSSCLEFAPWIPRMMILEEAPELGRLPMKKWQTDILWSASNSWKWQLDPGFGLPKSLRRKDLLWSAICIWTAGGGGLCVNREQKCMFFYSCLQTVGSCGIPWSS